MRRYAKLREPSHITPTEGERPEAVEPPELRLVQLQPADEQVTHGGFGERRRLRAVRVGRGHGNREIVSGRVGKRRRRRGSHSSGTVVIITGHPVGAHARASSVRHRPGQTSVDVV